MMVTMPNNDHAVVMRMPMITMHASMHAAVFDYDGFSTCNRRRRNGDGGERGNDISKLLHSVSSSVERGLNVTRDARFPRTDQKPEENSEHPFSLRCARFDKHHSMMA